MIPDEVLAILELASPDTLSCDGTDDVICGLVDWLECNTDPDISRCMVPCNHACDCVIEGVEGTGFSTCDTDTNYVAVGYEGWCLPNWEGDCTTDDDCPSIVGYTCDGGSCTAPTACSSDSDCDDMQDGLKMCNDETGQCGPEFCSDSTDCISDGYVCQSSTICFPGCDDVPCDDPLECGDDGLCYIAEMCDTDEDCEDIPFAPTCINITAVDLGEEQLVDRICGATCNNDTDCEYIPWGECTGGICLTNPNPDYFLNMTGMACDSSADCTDEDFPNCFDDTMIGDAICVPDDPDMFFDMTGMTMCDTDDDCTDDMPVCVNDTQMLMESGLCGPGCDTDSDCDDGWECEELPEVGYSVCVTTDQCTVTR